MALSIRKQSVEQKARMLAARHRTTITGAIERALDHELARDKGDYDQFMARIRAIQEEVAKLPDTGLTEDEIMGWDENGLPT